MSIHDPRQPRFSYRAGAAALGGHMSRPFCEPLETQASVSLPPTGGYAAVRAEGYRYREVVSFRAAYSYANGNRHEQKGTTVHETSVASVVEGLNILDMVTADRVVARLTSERSAEDDPSAELAMLPTGSHFQNLRIAGTLVELKPHAELLDEAVGTKSAIASELAGRVVDPDPPGAAGKGTSAPKGMPPAFSIFEDAGLESASPPGVSCRRGCRVDIPGFGSVYLGEYLVTEDSRRLTMVRIELGCPYEGDLAATAVEGNGRPY